MKNSKSIRENINKNEWRKEFVRISKQFFENATIGGLRRLFGQHPLKMPYSMMWAVMWLCAVGYAFYLNILTIIIYCKFDVKTKITYETADEFNFPAITMCNENIFRRSVVGGSFLAMVMLASYVTTDTKRISRIAVENNRTCFAAPTPFSEQLQTEGLEFVNNNGFERTMQLLSMSSNDTVLKCWWDSREIECTDLFLNHLTDLGWCFTFNPSRLFLLDATGVSNMRRISTVSGNRKGLKLLLNINQPEYCGAAEKYLRNPGFRTVIHNPDVQPRMQTNKPLNFGPGYHYDIAIKPVHYRKRTEHLGKCISFMNYPLHPEIKYYIREQCVYDAYIKLVWEQCQCYPLAFQKYLLGISKLVGVKIQNLTGCWDAKLSCQRIVSDSIYMQEYQMFPSCKDPCVDVKYNVQLSNKQFPSTPWMKKLAEELTVNETYFQKNIILANFYFADMNYAIMEDFQAVTALDLFRYFGGIMGLFLGVSVVCLAELTLILVYCGHVFHKTCSRNKKIYAIAKKKVVNHRKQHVNIVKKRGKVTAVPRKARAVFFTNESKL